MYILAGIGGVFVLFLLFVATRPSAFRIERSVTMNAPAEKIFGLIDDFHEWTAWSPWEKLDPAMQKTYEGAARGKGAVYKWQGNKKVGKGMMTNVESTPNSRVEIRLQFMEPFPADNRAIFTIEPGSGGCKVTWAMEGNNNFGMKLFGVLMNMDKMIGKDFEKGLEAMKAASGSP